MKLSQFILNSISQSAHLGGIKLTTRLIVVLFILLPFVVSAQTYELTGYWQSDVGACYQIRQKGNEIAWVCEANMNSWAFNSFYGKIEGNIITGKWYDMPSNPQNNFAESMTVRIENDSRLVKISESMSYNGRVLTKLNGPCGSSNTTPTVVQGTAKGKIYFFKGSEYIRFDIAADKVDPGYPQSISSATWNGLWTSGIDAAVNYGNSKIYFFKGSEYIRFDIAAGKVDPGYPQTISSATWNGLWTNGIDAAVNYGNGKIYFFKGSEYIRFDIAADKADPGYPQQISNWKMKWTEGIDAATIIY